MRILVKLSQRLCQKNWCYQRDMAVRHPVDEHLVYKDLMRHCHFVEIHYIVTLLSDYS